jgi:hypothetical protein
MRTVTLAVTLFATASLCANGAQAAPWCAHLNTGLNTCSFYSFQQCMATLSGNGGFCSRNRFETPYSTGSVARRSYRRAY